MARYLVVANQTVGGPALMEAIRARVQPGATWHVVVPATLPRDYVRVATLAVDPLSGGFIPDASGLDEAIEVARKNAEERLQQQLMALSTEGIEATGEVGSADPLEAIADAIERQGADEIVLSTLPASISRWVKMDLPARTQRRFNVKVVQVPCAAAVTPRPGPSSASPDPRP